MKPTQFIAIFTCIIFLAIFVWYIYQQNDQNILRNSAEEWQYYENKQYNFSFYFPQEYKLIEDSLHKNGSLQLIDDNNSNKIELVIVDTNKYSEDEDSRVKLEEDIDINGQLFTRKEKSYSNTSLTILNYITNIPNKDKYMILNMYGNKENFYILDDIVKTLSFDR